MGVYLSEINMPKDEGSKLVLQIFPSGEVYDEHGFRLGIANWAEAIPVPPHGRLGDLDALLAKLKKDPLFPLVEQYGMSGVIEAQPTVIPAEPEKEETT